MSYITAEQIAAARDKAVAAVRDLYAGDQDAERRAFDRVTDAVTIYSVTAAEIASLTGLRQLLVARLINAETSRGEAARAEALKMARHDADRYRDEVRQVVHDAVVRSVEGGMPESRAAELYGVDRQTVRTWLGKQPANR